MRRGLLPFLLGATMAVAMLGSQAFAQAPGDAGRGQTLFETKHCSHCHRPRGERAMGPPLEALRRPQGAYELAGRLWNHAPAMFTVLKQEGIEWPRVSAAEMADIMAFLLADPARDPALDLSVGRALLVSKGCLKCHSYKREGGRLGPDLAERRASYAPAATWAATMWAHTPRMAATAIQQGVLYPRFADDEMAQLLGFLRGASGAQ